MRDSGPCAVSSGEGIEGLSPLPERSRIKVVRIITRLNVGGPAQHAVLLTARLNGDRFQSKLLAGTTDSHEGDMSFLAENHGTPFVRVEELCNEAGLFGDLKSFCRLVKVIKKEKADIVDLHLLKARFFGGLAAKIAGVPVIVETFHGHLFTGYFGRLKTAAILTTERLLGWFVMHRLIAISEIQKEELIRYRISPARKIDIIPLGLDLNKFLDCSKWRGEFRRELGVADATILIGVVGRLVPIKGLCYLLDAVSQVLRATDADFQLIVVGDGPLRGALESQVSSLDIEKRVRFLGWRFDLEKIYADLDFVALSSLNEGTPVSLIEAMAAGKAVVATRVGGVPDVVEHEKTGILVSPKNPLELSKAITRLLGNPRLRNCLGERARFSVYPKYDVSRLIQDMKEYYRSLLP
ncbi:MAG: glycosyltransferase family 4 protein, partial [Deltaproteobacteria bacterium]|nr:glycosyltransferase family 4 protein [Deltaproteobacteria bacterium]